MDYALLKSIHVACVAVTFALFLGRGVLMQLESPLTDTRLLRIFPHVNDTVLLASAVWMAAWSGQYPFAQSWLTAKLLGLVVYIGAGMIALSRKRSRHTRTTAGAFALLAFAYIAAVAVTRSPVPFTVR